MAIFGLADATIVATLAIWRNSTAGVGALITVLWLVLAAYSFGVRL